MKCSEITSWVRSAIIKPFLDVYLLRDSDLSDEVKQTPVQAKWHLMSILGTFDLFNLRLQQLPANSSEALWIVKQQAEFQSSVADLIQSGLLDGFQQIATDFSQYMKESESFHEHWVALLASRVKFDGNSFGYWINQHVAEIPWSGSGSNPAASDLCFYTTLLFLDLGISWDTKEYWASSIKTEIFPMYSISAELLISYYYELAKRPSSRSASWKAFLTDIQYLKNVIATERNSHFLSKFDSFTKELSRTEPSLLFVCVNGYSAIFEGYSREGLETLGTQLDGATLIEGEEAS